MGGHLRAQNPVLCLLILISQVEQRFELLRIKFLLQCLDKAWLGIFKYRLEGEVLAKSVHVRGRVVDHVACLCQNLLFLLHQGDVFALDPLVLLESSFLICTAVRFVKFRCGMVFLVAIEQLLVAQGVVNSSNLAS